MLPFMPSNLDEALANPGLVAGLGEVLGRELLERVAVKGVLKVLEGESVVENDLREGGALREDGSDAVKREEMGGGCKVGHLLTCSQPTSASP